MRGYQASHWGELDGRSGWVGPSACCIVHLQFLYIGWPLPCPCGPPPSHSHVIHSIAVMPYLCSLFALRSCPLVYPSLPLQLPSVHKGIFYSASIWQWYLFTSMLALPVSTLCWPWSRSVLVSMSQDYGWAPVDVCGWPIGHQLGYSKACHRRSFCVLGDGRDAAAIALTNGVVLPKGALVQW